MKDRTPHLSCNQYVWQTFWEREGRKLAAGGLDQALGEMAAAGIDGFEPSVGTAAEVRDAARAAADRGLQMRSVYVGSTLHDPGRAKASRDRALEIARAARDAGATILVTNPDPIRWGEPVDKDDTQLRFQAESLDTLGRDVSALGMRLAYHHHDAELRAAAREMHHMLVGTDPGHVGLCLDTHWVYRGAGHSAVAVYDVTTLYADRVVELHLRQSRDRVWSESLEDGDIDYSVVARILSARGVHPHLVLEQAVEAGTPRTLDVVEAHRRTVTYARRVLAPLG